MTSFIILKLYIILCDMFSLKNMNKEKPKSSKYEKIRSAYSGAGASPSIVIKSFATSCWSSYWIAEIIIFVELCNPEPSKRQQIICLNRTCIQFIEQLVLGRSCSFDFVHLYNLTVCKYSHEGRLYLQGIRLSEYLRRLNSLSAAIGRGYDRPL